MAYRGYGARPAGTTAATPIDVDTTPIDVEVHITSGKRHRIDAGPLPTESMHAPQPQRRDQQQQPLRQAPAGPANGDGAGEMRRRLREQLQKANSETSAANAARDALRNQLSVAVQRAEQEHADASALRAQVSALRAQVSALETDKSQLQILLQEQRECTEAAENAAAVAAEPPASGADDEAREEALGVRGLYSLEERRVFNGRAAGWCRAEEVRHAEAVRCVKKLASGGAAVKSKADKDKVVKLVRESFLATKWSEERGMLDDPLPISVARDAHMGLDILRALRGIDRAWQLFATPRTTYQNEEGVDQHGLSVDLFAKAFDALRALRLPTVSPGDQPATATSLFETFGGGLCLPARDATTRNAPSLLLSRGPAGHGSGKCSGTHSPFDLEGADASSTKQVEEGGCSQVGPAPAAAGSSSSAAGSSSSTAGQPPASSSASTSGPSPSEGSPPSVGSLEAWRLMGRLLAWTLCLPEGFYVSDRLPDFVLEYLCTDNFESIRGAEGALAALDQLSGADGASTPTRECLDKPCAEMEVYLCAAPVRCDLLPHGYWPECALWSANKCPCATGVLYDATKESDFLGAVWDTYVTTRRESLCALKDGFQGADWALAERQLRDSAGVLQLLRPATLAARLRGRPVRGGAALWAELDVLRQEADEDESKWRGASAAEYDETAVWLGDYVAALDGRGAQLLLKFITGATALVPLDKRGGDYVRPSVLVMNDYDWPRSERAGLPTASTCVRQLYLPVYPSRDVFTAKVELALANYEVEERQAGGSAFGYA